MATEGPNWAQAALLVQCPVCHAGELDEAEGCWDDLGRERVPIHAERIEKVKREVGDESYEGMDVAA